MKFLVSVTFFIIFLQLICKSQVSNSPGSYSLLHFTDEDGLPQNSIKNIAIDNLGFVWMPTENGLVRFDGHKFKIFNKSTVRHLKSNRFSHMRFDEQNKLYAVTDYKEYLNIQNGRVYDTHSLTKTDTALDNWALACGVRSKCLWATGLPPRYNLKLSEWDACLLPTSKGSFFECFRDKVLFLDRNRKDSVNIAFGDSELCDFFLFRDELFYFNESNKIAHITKNGITDCVLAGDILKDTTYGLNKKKVTVFWDIIGRTVLLYFNESFYAVKNYSNGQLQTALIITGFNIDNKRIVTYHYDALNKRLFLGSDVKGLYILNHKDFRAVLENDGERSNVYYAQVPYTTDTVLTAQGSLLNTVNGEGRNLNKKLAKLSDAAAIILDKRGFIWIKEWNVLYKCDRNYTKLASWVFPREIATIYETRDTNLVIGLKVRGLYALNTTAESNQPELINDLAGVSFMAADSENRIWIGTGNGLFILNRQTHTLLEVNGLQGKYIRSLYIAAHDEIWITTYEDGMYLYRKEILTALPVDKNDFLATAHCIVPDHKGFFWITTNKGLFKAWRKDLLAFANKEQKEVFYYYYGKDRGFNTNEFNGGCQPCGLMLDNGIISLPSLDGLVCFNPDSVVTELPDYPLIIDKIKVDSHEISFGDTVLLAKDFRQVNIEVSTIYFGDEKNLQFSYMLTKEGTNTGVWFPLAVTDNISFSTLPSGTYQLRIRKINGFGKDNFTELATTLIVPYAFYETWWFKGVLVLLVILMVYLYIRMRILYVVQNNRLLELRIARRTRKLQHTLRALETSESSLRRQTQIQEMLIAAISHDIKSPMKYLLFASQKMQHFIVKKEYASLPAFNERIQDTASHVYNILDNLLQYISIQLKKGELKFEWVDISEMVGEKVATFKDIAQNNQTVIENNIPSDTILYTNRALLAVVIHNLVDNAVKYTANGKVKIGFEKHPDASSLVIEDTGTGIGQELVDWLNNVANNRIDIDTASGHQGMGLIIVKELLSTIDATIDAVSTDNDGTLIRIIFNYQL